MPVTPEMQRLLVEEAEAELDDLTDVPPVEMRRRVDEAQAKFDRELGERLPVGGVKELTVPLPGRAVPIRLYHPTAVEGARPPPVFIYFHGGGWIVGSLDGSDATCRELCEAAHCAVVSVDYRLAPEHKFPAAVDDAVGVTRWVADVRNGRSLDVDASRIAVGGASAGGNLAGVVAVDSRDSGAPRLRGQVLLFPVIDTATDRASIRENAHGYGFEIEFLPVMWSTYLRSDADKTDPRVALLRTPHLRGLAPALVLTAEYDMLRDEGEEYAHRMASEGVDVTLHRYDGVVHSFPEYRTLAAKGRSATPEGRAAIAEVAGWLRTRFAADA
jgi:acetyl esterase